MLILLLLLFFFKQRTAYDMRISYWSSDVCSSYLIADQRSAIAAQRLAESTQTQRHLSGAEAGGDDTAGTVAAKHAHRMRFIDVKQGIVTGAGRGQCGQRRHIAIHAEHAVAGEQDQRSEEQTSELQSLMRSSYTVFCWKK